MEERVLKVISILSVVLAMIVSISLQFFPEMHEKSVLAAETRANLLERGKKQVSDVIQDESGEGLLENGDIDIEAQLKIECSVAQRAYSVSDKELVYNIVQGSHNHSDNAWHSEIHHKLCNGLIAEGICSCSCV